jgi:hypothetical protein
MRRLVYLATLFGSLLSTHTLAEKSDLTGNPNLWMNVTAFGEAHLLGNELHLLSTGNWFYLTKKRYADFELTLEVNVPKLEEYVNSGVMFRGQIVYQKDIESYQAYGYQAEVDPSDRRWSGGLYEQATERQWLFPLHKERSAPGADLKQNHSPEWGPSKAGSFRVGDWNRYRIRAVGPEIKIWVNDVLTTHVTDTRFTEGHIGMQHHGSKAFAEHRNAANTVKFRNITIEEL